MRAGVLLALALCARPAAADVTVSVRSTPTALEIRFDGSSAVTPFERVVPDGSRHTLEAVTPQAGPPGTRHAFDSWNSTVVSPTLEITALPGLPACVAAFHEQYAVRLSFVPGGAIVPGPGTYWRDSDSSFTISALPNPGFSFGEWVGHGDGAYSGTDPSATLTVHGPLDEHASFAIDTITTTVETIPHGLTVSVDGVPHRTPFTLTQQALQAIRLDAPESQSSFGGAVAFANWSDGGARSHVIGPSASATFVATYAPLPARSGMTAAWPNPSTGSSRLEIALAATGPARLVIHDLRGRIVRRLVDGPLTAGIHPVAWDGKDDGGQPVPSGIYFAVGRWGGFEGEERLVRLH